MYKKQGGKCYPPALLLSENEAYFNASQSLNSRVEMVM